MLTCTDEQYQHWWPGTHFVFHTLKRTSTNVGNLVCMDEYVGEYRVKFQAVVKRLVPNQEILWQMQKFCVLWPAWLRLQLTDTPAGLHIVHTLSAGFHGVGSVLDGLLRGYLSATFKQPMAAHANAEFTKLRDFLRELEMAVSQTHEACSLPASAIAETMYGTGASLLSNPVGG